MKKIGCRLATAAMAVAVAISSVSCGVGEDEVTVSRELEEDEVFQINGKTCRLPVMKLLLMNNMNLYGESYGISFLRNEDLKVQKKYEQYVKKISMEEVTKVYCMVALADSQGITLSDEQLELARWAGEDCYQSLSESERETLAVTQEDVEDIYQKYALADKLYRILVQDVNEEVSDDEARVMEARQIFTTDEAQAKKAVAELEAQAEFSTVAANYSDANEIGVTLQRGMLPEEAEAVVFSMENGETSDLIRTDQGFYIFYCDNKFDEEQTQIHKADIVEQRKQDAFQEVYRSFVDTIHSRLNESVWDEISIRELESFPYAEFYNIYDKYLGEAVWDDL